MSGERHATTDGAPGAGGVPGAGGAPSAGRATGADGLPVDRVRELVPLRRLAVRQPLCWFRLGVADRPVVELGQRVRPGDTVLERVRDPRLAELPLPRGMDVPRPLSVVQRRPAETATDVAPSIGFDAPGRVLHVDAGHRVRAAIGRVSEPVQSSISGRVEVVEPGGIGIRADGVGLTGITTHGDPVRGRLLILVAAPDAELRASAVDVQGAGAIIVAGAGLDIETLTRARATGAAGIVTGGIAGKDLGTLAAADVRQRASLHPTLGFAVLVLDGYGRRPLPGVAWSWLTAAEGTEVGIVLDPPMLVIGPDVQAPQPIHDVRITGGETLGVEGRLLGSAGQARGTGGLYRAAARVSVPPAVGAPGDQQVVALADLERFE